MRNILLASAALFGLALAMPAAAQTEPMAAPTAADTAPAAGADVMPTKKKMRHTAGTMAPNTSTGARPGNEIGTGMSEPSSSNASNINSSTTRSTIAPRLPDPAVGANATPAQYLRQAQRALAGRRTGAAQEALERAETRLLDRSTAPTAAGTPDSSAMVQNIAEARQAVARGDRATANKLIAAALASSGEPGMVDTGMSPGMSPGMMAPNPHPMASPISVDDAAKTGVGPAGTSASGHQGVLPASGNVTPAAPSNSAGPSGTSGSGAQGVAPASGNVTPAAPANSAGPSGTAGSGAQGVTPSP